MLAERIVLIESNSTFSPPLMCEWVEINRNKKYCIYFQNKSRTKIKQAISNESESETKKTQNIFLPSPKWDN